MALTHVPSGTRCLHNLLHTYSLFLQFAWPFARNVAKIMFALCVFCLAPKKEPIHYHQRRHLQTTVHCNSDIVKAIICVFCVFYATAHLSAEEHYIMNKCFSRPNHVLRMVFAASSVMQLCMLFA